MENHTTECPQAAKLDDYIKGAAKYKCSLEWGWKKKKSTYHCW